MGDGAANSKELLAHDKHNNAAHRVVTGVMVVENSNWDLLDQV